MKNYTKKINSAFKKYKYLLLDIAGEIKPYTNIGYFEIVYNVGLNAPSLNTSNYVCLLDDVIEIIKKKGILELSDVEKIAVWRH